MSLNSGVNVDKMEDKLKQKKRDDKKAKLK